MPQAPDSIIAFSSSFKAANQQYAMNSHGEFSFFEWFLHGGQHAHILRSIWKPYLRLEPEHWVSLLREWIEAFGSNPSHFLPAWLVLGGYPSEKRLVALCTDQRVIDYLSEASPVQANPGKVRTHLEGLSIATLRAWLYMLFTALSGNYGRSYTLHVSFDCVPSSTVCDRFFFNTKASCSHHRLTDTYHYFKNLFMLCSMSRSRADEFAMLASVLRFYFACVDAHVEQVSDAARSRARVLSAMKSRWQKRVHY